jgi:hypothetical protein
MKLTNESLLVLWFIHAYRRNRIILQQQISLLLILSTLQIKWRQTKKFLHRHRHLQREKQTPMPHYALSTRGSKQVKEIDIFNRCGLFKSQFNRIFRKLKSTITFTTKRALLPEVGFALTLQFLREHPKYTQLVTEYGISKATVYRTIRYYLPRIYYVLDEINWPEKPITNPFESICGAIDCSPHFRNRTHPGSLFYYRGDYRDYFFTVQAICGLDGELYQVDIGFGHNNDSGMLHLTNMPSFLREHNYNLLADGTYSRKYVVIPNVSKGAQWNYTHRYKHFKHKLKTENYGA